VQTIEQAAERLAVKVEGDAADCASLFVPVVNGGGETAEMRANQQKLLDSLEHYPFLGIFFGVSTTVASPMPDDCTPCITGFHGDPNSPMCLCSADPCPRAPPGIECPESNPRGGCQWYNADCPARDAEGSALLSNMFKNFLDSGAPMHPCTAARHLYC
jgi:hypothetical protein